MKNALWVISVLLLALSFGCSSDSGMQNPAGSNSGVLQVALTSNSAVATSTAGPVQPRELWVDIGQIDARKQSWQTVTTTTQMVNLMTLAGTESLIGATTLSDGSYTGLRLYIQDGYAIDDKGARHDLKVPSEKLELNVMFEVAKGKVTRITVDFNGPHSIHVIESQGNQQWILRPVLRVIAVKTS